MVVIYFKCLICMTVSLRLNLKAKSETFSGTISMVVADNLAAYTLEEYFLNFSTNFLDFAIALKMK